MVGKRLQLSRVKEQYFCDSFNGQFNQRIRVQSTTVAMTFGDNCYWYNGEFQ